MKIETLTRKLVRELAEEVTEIVQEYVDEYGLEASQSGSVRFDAASMTLKLDIAVPTRKAKAAQRDAAILGLDADIGTVFNLPTPTGRPRYWTIVEFNLRRHKYPVIAENENGKRYKFTVESVRHALAK